MLKHIEQYAHTTWAGALTTCGLTAFLYSLTIFTLPYLHSIPWILFRSLTVLRIFILMHDCSHLSLFPTVWANNWVGMLLGIIVLTPMKKWRRGHNYHHNNSGNLNVVNLVSAFRSGDTIFFTRREWDSLKPGWKKRALRIFRDPFVFFIIVPLLVFFIVYRHPGKRDHANTWCVTLLKMVEFAILTYIWPSFWWMELIALWMTAVLGIVLFHLQHGVNEGYRVDLKEYNTIDASVQGSTYLCIPWFLKWATLGIEYHHIHHLNTRVPCYKLAACHHDAPKLWWQVNHVTFSMAWSALRNVMWNEETRRYEPFN